MLCAGDTKMAALATRAHIACHQDYYVVPLPMTGTTASEFGQWVDAVVEGEHTATLVWDNRWLIAAGYEFECTQTEAIVAEPITWVNVSWWSVRRPWSSAKERNWKRAGQSTGQAEGVDS